MAKDAQIDITGGGMKLCKDCRFYQRSMYSGTDAWKYSRCLANPEREQNFVTGEVVDVPRFCDSTRIISDRCGPDAKWFEPREHVEAAQ